LRRIATLASEMNAPIQIHLHETAFEVEQSLNDHGMRPTERLDKLGLLSPLTQCVHMTQINERDIEILQATGAHVVHCPESNLKLASGFCPSHKLLEAGINVALGTDGAASNNDLNLLNEVRTASLLAKGVSQNAQALDANKSLEMATLNGAKALGLDNIIGSLEVGKQADICAFTMNELEQLPLYNPVSQLIYSASSNTVSHLWVNGKLLLNDRQLTTLNLSELKNKARRWAAQIAPSNG
jgi:5-methylthioadenosine/S-adenosylhomocysteine deaminase